MIQLILLTTQMLLHSIIYEQDDSPLKNRKKATRESARWVRLINNKYINSRIQTQPKSVMNPFPPGHNSFENNSFFLHFYSYPRMNYDQWERFITDFDWVWILELIYLLFINLTQRALSLVAFFHFFSGESSCS